MKARTASVIEKISDTIIYIIYLPFAIVGNTFGLVYWGCVEIKNWVEYFYFVIGHKLFLLCDEKDVIKNKEYYKKFTAKALNQYLKNKEDEKIQNS